MYWNIVHFDSIDVVSETVRRNQRGTEDNVSRRLNIDGVRKRTAHQVGIEQRDDAADTRYLKLDARYSGQFGRSRQTTSPKQRPCLSAHRAYRYDRSAS